MLSLCLKVNNNEKKKKQESHMPTTKIELKSNRELICSCILHYESQFVETTMLLLFSFKVKLNVSDTGGFA